MLSSDQQKEMANAMLDEGVDVLWLGPDDRGLADWRRRTAPLSAPTLIRAICAQ